MLTEASQEYTVHWTDSIKTADGCFQKVPKKQVKLHWGQKKWLIKYSCCTEFSMNHVFLKISYTRATQTKWGLKRGPGVLSLSLFSLFRAFLLHSSHPRGWDVMSEAWRKRKGCATTSNLELRLRKHWHLCNGITSLVIWNILKQWNTQLCNCTAWAL